MNDPASSGGLTRVNVESAEIKRASSASSEESAAPPVVVTGTSMKKVPSPRYER